MALSVELVALAMEIVNKSSATTKPTIGTFIAYSGILRVK